MRRRDDLSAEQSAVLDKYKTTSQVSEFRLGDVMVKTTTKTRTAIIDFADILTMVKIEEDEDFNGTPPWRDCDGWEHEFVPIETFREEVENRITDRYPDMEYEEFVKRVDAAVDSVASHHPGYVSHSNIVDGRGIIVVDMKTVKKQWQGEYSSASGEHRQIYEERMSRCRREAISTLHNWYTHGWSCYWVSVDFLGENGSLGGIYADDEDAEHVMECCKDVAGGVASALAKQGYTIVGAPVSVDYNSTECKARRLRDNVARHMGFDDYEKYRTWVMDRPEPPKTRQRFSRRRTIRKLEIADG